MTHTSQVIGSDGTLAPIGNTAAIDIDVFAVDYIQISETTSNVMVTMKYIPKKNY
jgi:hypothetical protein